MRVRQAHCTVAPSHVSAGRPWSRIPKRAAMRSQASASVRPGIEGEVEDFLFLAAEQGQDAVRGQPGEGLAELEVVGELRAVGLAAAADLGGQLAAGGHRLPQLPDQVGVLGEPLDQDRPGALQGGRRVRDLVAGEALRGALRVLTGVAEQQVGQRLQAGLAGRLGLGAAFGFVGQVQVFQPGLGVGRADLRLELAGQLALRSDLLEDRVPAIIQFPEVAQSLLERAQLRVVEGAGDFLAVPGDERHGRAAVEQVHCGADLPDGHAQLVGDALVHGRGLVLRHRSIVPARWRLSTPGG